MIFNNIFTYDFYEEMRLNGFSNEQDYVIACIDANFYNFFNGEYEEVSKLNNELIIYAGSL